MKNKRWLLVIKEDGKRRFDYRFYKTEKGARAAVDRLSKREDIKLQLFEQVPLSFANEFFDFIAPIF